MLSLTACPEPGCDAPAEVLDRLALPSTDGPVEHARVRCLHRHWFVLPVATLAEKTPRGARSRPTRQGPGR
ncbi:MAG TPA: hypothetical protein VFT95_00735 [Micromonosporaceae bacterium]|nr:hypothetical protein [Micromonosporaceae bacterium]